MPRRDSTRAIQTARPASLGLWALLLVASPCYAERPELIISEETTVFLGPVRDDGTIDYVAAWNAKFSRGVTPENNAAAALFKLMRRPLESQAFDRRLAAMLGVDPGMDRLAITPWPSHPEAETQFEKSQQGPWQADDLPLVDQWLRANGEGLDALAAAVRRPRCWWPVVAAEGERATLFNALYPQWSESRFLARSLLMRGLHRVNTGDLDGAISDFQSLQALGRHAGREPLALPRLVDFSIQHIALPLAEHILVHPELTREQAARLRDGLLPLRTPEYASEVLRVGERLWMLDGMLAEFNGHSVDGEELSRRHRINFRSPSFDINEALRYTSGWYLEWAGHQPTNIGQAQALSEAIEARYDALPDFPQTADTPEQRQVFFTRWVVDRFWLHYTLGLTPVHISLQMDNGHAVRLRVAAALALHRIDHQRYPQTLRALVPDYLEALPTDRYDGRPLTYEPGEDGKTYLLYSVGPDGEDDGGLDDVSDGDRVIGDPVPDPR